MFRDDGYRGPKLVVLVVLMLIAATVIYILRASREAAKAGSGPDRGTDRVRRIEQLARDAERAGSGHESRRRPSR